MLQQGGLDLHRVLSPIGDWDLLDRVRDRSSVLGSNLALAQRLCGSWINRIQDLTGHRPPGPEPLHRLRPTPRLHPGTPHLAGDQVRQPPQPKPTGNIPLLQLGQHHQLPELHPNKLSLQHAQLSQQLRIRRGSQLIDHMFDSTVQAISNQL